MVEYSCDVVIPYHRVPVRWVIDAIDSILNQQNADCVLHVVGDAVDEDMHRTIKGAFLGAPDVHFHMNTDAIGPFRSFHKAFHDFRTPYSAFQASDDISLPHRIHHSISLLRKQHCEIYSAAYENFLDWTSADDEFLKERIGHTGSIDLSGAIHGCSPSGKLNSGAMVMSNEMFLRLNGFADWFTSADTEFAERARRAGVPIVISDSIVLLRRMHTSSLYHGEEHGHHSAERNHYNAEMIERYERFVPGFDPRPFGSLDKYLKEL